MPVGSSNGKIYEEDFELALEEIQRFQRPVITPRVEQMLDNNEIIQESMPVPQEPQMINTDYQVSRENDVTVIKPAQEDLSIPPEDREFMRELKKVERDINIEDRREEPSRLDLGNMLTGLKNQFIGPDELPEVPATTLSTQLGSEDIKTPEFRDLGSTSPLDELIHGTVDAVNLAGHTINAISSYPEAAERRFLINPEISSKDTFSEGTKAGNRLLGTGGEERYITWPEKAIRSLVDAFKLPGDVYAGEVDLNSPAGISRATELAGALIFGPAPIARKVVDGTLGSFAGVKAKIPEAKLKKAEELIATKKIDPVKDPETFWRETGFFQGVDGKLRYEISDQGAHLITTENLLSVTPKGTRLENVLRHPELYEAYPELKDIKVKYNGATDVYAVFNQESNTITMGKGSLKNPSILLHEIQHWIQKKEGFAAGGAPVYDAKLRFDDRLTELKNYIQKNPNASPEIHRAMGRLFKLDAERRNVGRRISYDNYQKLAGEVESRNVQTRFENPKIYSEKYNEIAENLEAQGYRIRFNTRTSWTSTDTTSGGIILTDKKGVVIPTNKLPEAVQRDLAELNGMRASDLPPWRTQDVPPDQQAIFNYPVPATPYGYNNPLTPPD